MKSLEIETNKEITELIKENKELSDKVEELQSIVKKASVILANGDLILKNYGFPIKPRNPKEWERKLYE